MQYSAPTVHERKARGSIPHMSNVLFRVKEQARVQVIPFWHNNLASAKQKDTKINCTNTRGCDLERTRRCHRCHIDISQAKWQLSYRSEYLDVRQICLHSK